MPKYFVSIHAFDRLSDGEEANAQIYRQYDNNSQIQEYTTSNIRKIEATKLAIDGATYELHHTNVDAERITHRKPHPTVKREWDQNSKRIKGTIGEQQGILEKYVNEDLKGIRTNLFVDPGYAEVVVTKINELRRTLEGLNLRVDKLKDQYDNVKDEEGQSGVIKEKAPAPNAN